MHDVDSAISMDAAFAALVEAEAECAEIARSHRRLWILWQRFGWTPAQIDALPEHVVNYAMRVGA